MRSSLEGVGGQACFRAFGCKHIHRIRAHFVTRARRRLHQDELQHRLNVCRSCGVVRLVTLRNLQRTSEIAHLDLRVIHICPFSLSVLLMIPRALSQALPHLRMGAEVLYRVCDVERLKTRDCSCSNTTSKKRKRWKT